MQSLAFLVEIICMALCCVFQVRNCDGLNECWVGSVSWRGTIVSCYYLWSFHTSPPILTLTHLSPKVRFSGVKSDKIVRIVGQHSLLT